MNNEKQVPRSPKLQEYIQVWAASVGRVLQQVAGTPHTSQELSAEATQAQVETLREHGICVRFEAAQHLSGEQGFVLSKGDAVRLAQLLLAEPQSAQAALSDDYRDALGELFRQFAGTAAVAVKGLAGGEVSFKWSAIERLHDEPAVRVGLQWSSATLEPFTIVVEISPALATAFDPVSLPAALSPMPAVPDGRPSPPAPAQDPKLELLMDVELDVALRFGERQISLHDILDLNAGSVVELDQRIQDPVQLLVGGKVIARGEVVVVEGNYGLRVMEILSPQERIESLRK